MIKKLGLFWFVALLLLMVGCSQPLDEFAGIPDAIYLEINESIRYVGFLEYTSEDPSVASVDDEGRIVGVSHGETTVTIVGTTSNKIMVVTVGMGEEKQLIVDVIDIGQGDAILIQLPNDEVLMIDCGKARSDSWDQINSTLIRYQITTIDYFILTHNHADHYDLIPTLLDNYNVLNMYGSGSTRTNIMYLQIMQAIADAGLVIYTVEVGDKIIDEVGLLLQVVAVQKIENESNPNISSVCVKLTYLNTSFLFMGDAGFASSKDGEYTALASGIDLASDVLKVGHHGSDEASSNSFLEAVSPTYALITTAPDSTNHPHIDALTRLEAVGAQIYQSKDNGTITVISNGVDITILTEK
ncbi:MAG: MBL fold metallo-hydrolase [Bacilli bacterium]